MEFSGSSRGEETTGTAPTDDEIGRERRLVEVARLKAGVAKLGEELTSEIQNRKLRHPIAVVALVLMTLQVAASDLIFVWYGDSNGWNISAAAISAWMGTNVVEVVAAVLVIVNYLFPRARSKDA